MRLALLQYWATVASVLLMPLASGCIYHQPSEDPSSWRLNFSHIDVEVGNDTRANAVAIYREDAEGRVPFLIEALEESLHQELVVIHDREQARVTESYIDDLSGRGGYALILEFEGEFFSVNKVVH